MSAGNLYIKFIDLAESYWAYYPIMEATNDHDFDKNGQHENWHNNWYR